MKFEYKKYSNKLTKIKTMAKKKQFAEELEKNKNNPEKTWSVALKKAVFALGFKNHSLITLSVALKKAV